ncbi:MAG: winged helix-turn-helix domain-containing protein [Anaerolineales bacterium]|nr:winged helix-turn-helix domain-containing protein [Anaerolineales bacterium]
MERNNEDTPVLVGQTGPLNGQRWMVRDSLVVGRDAGCDIMIPSRQVSRNHARLVDTGDGTSIEDLGSKNGTHLNGDTLSEIVILKDGDVIQIAFAQQFIFLSSDATMPLEMGEMEAMAPIQEGLLRLEKSSRKVWIGEQELLPPLSASQFQLLEILYDNQERVISRKDIIAEIWGADNAVDVSEQALDALVRRLRDRLAAVEPSHPFIVTIRGHGLRLDNPPK